MKYCFGNLIVVKLFVQKYENSPQSIIKRCRMVNKRADNHEKIPQLLLRIPIPTETKQDILEKVGVTLSKKHKMVHVVSLNPETITASFYDDEFRLILQSADVRLIDGVGVLTACLIRGISAGERFTGVDFMEEILRIYSENRIRVLFLGGKPGIAEKVAKCYAQRYPDSRYKGLSGIADISSYEAKRDDPVVLSEIHAFNPDILFVSYGSPFQEKWIWSNRQALKGILCAGVGGAFDFIAGTVPRAPRVLRVVGLEWLFRLVMQPWRWRRQLSLIQFMRLVISGA